MQKRWRTLMALFAWMAFTLTLLQAESSTPSYRLMSVSQVLHKDNEDHPDVMLIGRVTEQLGDDTYKFTDGTGTLKLECEDSKLPMNQILVIRGRIEAPFLGIGQTVVHVLRWQVMGGANSSSLKP